MRPRRLELSAFGPFAGSETVDFDALADGGLFLVTGATGAGKTSLLDALCYALYGKVPGTRRPERLRSDHAPTTLDTEVACEFSLRGEDWRVTRKPPHERARRRGTGTAMQKPTATLSRRGRRGWEPVATGVEEVNGTVAAALGLDAEQFAQVVVLPQGRVEHALAADARERERLLSSLFATGRFAAVTERLAERARGLAAAVARHEERLDAVRVEAGLRWREVAKETGCREPDDPPAVQEELDALVAGAGAAEAAVTAEADQSRARARAASEALRAAEREASRWRRRQDAEALLEALDRERDSVDDARRRADRAEAAAPCRPLLEEATQVGGRLAAAETARAAAVAALPRDLLPVATPSRTEVDTALQAVRAAQVRAASAAGLSETAEEARLRAREGEREARALEEAAERAVSTAAEHESGAAEAAEAWEVARDALRQLDAYRADSARLQAMAQAAADVRVRAEAWTAAREHALRLAEQTALARDAHLELVRRSLEGMAGALARDLRQGDPCPVCGSTEHPAPAAWADPVAPDDVDAAEQAAERARRGAEDAAAARDAALAALEEARAAAGPAAGDPRGAAEHAAAAGERVRAAARLAAEAGPIATRVAQLRAQAERDRAEAAEHRRRAEGLRAAARLENERAASDALRLRELLDGEDDAAAVTVRLAGTETRLVALAAAVADVERARMEADACAERTAALVAAQGFTDIEQARAALLDPPAVAELRRRAEEHDTASRLAAATLADPEIAALEGEPPDIELSARDADQAARAAEAATEREAAVRRAADALRRLARRHASLEESGQANRADAERVRLLADICRGPGNARRMSLERYVLAAALEDVTARASLRLSAMTDGRYTLHHSDERARGNAASGLSILVSDAFTGTERDVGTLSGGETFQAALALALGIADAVASRGAVRLDTLFVDEGFGSLDAEALEQAMTELDRLREGGRLVGVVSHVPGLRERIPAGLEVVRTRSGSRVETVGGEP